MAPLRPLSLNHVESFFERALKNDSCSMPEYGDGPESIRFPLVGAGPLGQVAGGINGARAATFSSFFEIFFERNSYRVERRNDGVEFDTIRDLNLKCF